MCHASDVRMAMHIIRIFILYLYYITNYYMVMVMVFVFLLM
jgi:hypothetical protein|tara:strand:+ start:1145 stop:1267 length:123 start_codon:yes stop_codon:yes gene_type:complete